MRYLAYRGEYGWADQVLSTRLGSLTFSSKEAATEYALVPNDARMRTQAINPRLITAELQIINPVVCAGDDPFIEFSDIQAAVGRQGAQQIALSHSTWIEATDYWSSRYARDYASVQTLLAKEPEALKDLYCQAYPIFDDPRCVALFAANGYDGAIHAGNAEFSEHEEYRVFGVHQIEILDVQHLNTVSRLIPSPRG